MKPISMVPIKLGRYYIFGNTHPLSWGYHKHGDYSFFLLGLFTIMWW